MSEILFVIALLGGLWAWGWFLTGRARVFWLTTMGIIGLVVISAEIIGKVTTGSSISQMYWDWSVLHISTHWIVMGIMLCGWLSLLWHLSAKVLNKK